MTERPPLDFRRDADRFDPGWYRAAYPDLPAGDDDAALAHFVAIGSLEGRQPNPDFSAEWYLTRYPRAAVAVGAGRLCGPYHDYLRRLRDGLPRRPSAATLTVGIDLEGAAPHAVELALRLASRAAGWDFWLRAPPGGLPAGPAGANIVIASGDDRPPPIDLWLDLGVPDRAPPTGPLAALGPLMERLGDPPTARSPAALDRALEALRKRVLESCPLVPASRQGGGPVHRDPARAPAIRITVRRLDPAPCGGGVVLRDPDGIVAELPPPATDRLHALVDLRNHGDLWLTVSDGLIAELAPAAPPEAEIDLIVTAGAGHRRRTWQRTLEAAAAVRSTGQVSVVGPPPGLDLPTGCEVFASLADALGHRPSPAMLVPVGTRPFPQAAGQAAASLASDGRSYTARSAIRHPDGHLAPWPVGPTDDPELFARWRRGHVTVLSTAGRRQAARRLAAGGRWAPADTDAASLAAIDADSWPTRLRPQPDRAPQWLRLDARPDGGVVDRLRLRGDRLAAGGRLLLIGRTDGALADRCPVIARVARRAGPLDRFVLPASGDFAWPIELPVGADCIEIVPDGWWRTAQDSRDARPLLFRLVAVRYRPPSPSSPSAVSRSR